MKDSNEEQIVFCHLYNPDGMRSIPGAIRAAERLGYRCDIEITRDAQDNIHSVIVTAGIRMGTVTKIKALP